MIKAATFTAAAAFALSAISFSAAAQESTDGYVRSAPAGVFVKSPFGACVRTGYWTPAMANSECDPDLVPKPAAAAPSAPPPPPRAAAPAPAAPPKPTVVTLKSSELFDFNKATLTPAARSKLDSEVVAKIREVRNL